MTLSPPFAYFGGKTRLAQRIADLMPPHESYLEPFAGSLAVLLAKKPAKIETVNDIDGDIVAFWRVLRDRPDELATVCSLTPHSREEFEDAVCLDGADDLERARRVWVRLTQGRSSTLRGATGWRHYQDPDGTTLSFPGYLEAYVDRMPPAALRLRGVQIECRDALRLIADHGRSAKSLVYADPPYLGSTRTRSSTSRYRHELADEAGHRDLAEVLHACGGTVMLSGYASPLYDELYGDWHRTEWTAFTGNALAGDRTEVLWSNVPLGSAGLW